MRVIGLPARSSWLYDRWMGLIRPTTDPISYISGSVEDAAVMDNWVCYYSTLYGCWVLVYRPGNWVVRCTEKQSERVCEAKCAALNRLYPV